METLKDYIMEKHSAPILPATKLRIVWDEIKAKLGDSFDRELLDNLDRKVLNDVLWKLETKYNLGIMQ